MTPLPAGRQEELELELGSVSGSSALQGKVSHPSKHTKTRQPRRLVMSSPQSTAETPLFSPTHTSPTDLLLPSSPGQFHLRPSSSLQSIQSSFRNSSSSTSSSTIHPLAYTSTSTSSSSSFSSGLGSNRDNSIESESSTSSDVRKLAEAPVNVTSPRLQLPSIQTAFNSPQRGDDDTSQHSATQSTKSAGSSAIRGFSLTPKTSLPPRHGSSAYSTPTTTITTPSSIGLHQAFQFSPLVNHNDLLLQSPATSSGHDSDIRLYDNDIGQEFGGKTRMMMPDPDTVIRTSRQTKRKTKSQDSFRVITPMMLRTRLAASNLTNKGLVPLSFSWSPSPSADDHRLDFSAKSPPSRLATPGLHGETLNATQLEIDRDLKIIQSPHLVTNLDSISNLQGQGATKLDNDLGPFPLDRAAPRSLYPAQSSLSFVERSGSFSHLEADGKSGRGKERAVLKKRLSSALSTSFPVDDDNNNNNNDDDLYNLNALHTAIPSNLSTTHTSQGSGVDFELYNEDPILLLYITEAESTLSPKTLSVLQKSGAIHIQIPGTAILDRLQFGNNWQPTHFSFLEPFIVDDMSKRRYSELMDSNSSKERKPYWHPDIVLVGGDDTSDDSDDMSNEGGNGHSSYSMPTTPGRISSASMAAQVFADAVHKLSSRDEMTKGIYYLQGGVDELQAVYGLQDAPPDVFEKSIDDSISRQQILDRPREVDLFDPRSKLSVSPSTTLNRPSRLSESPGRITAEHEEKFHTLPLQTTLSASPAPPTRSTRLARPLLARLNTSETTRKVSALPSAELAKLAPLSTSRLTLDTNMGKTRAATMIGRITQHTDEPSVSPSLLHIRELGRESAVPDHSKEKSFVKAADNLATPSSPLPFQTFTLASKPAPAASFEPSEILSNFLYLGPDITSANEVEYLRNRWGIKRILNAAYEIEDGGGKDLKLNDVNASGIEKYKKIPMKDTVEAQGVQRDIEEACAFLDDAKLHSAPVYVHCKAGKSRSVLLVMAYLIHANRWTLPKVYSYVVERRQTVSPNIGFVAELMIFEERRLQTKRNASSTRPESDSQSNPDNSRKWSNRDSLPTSQSNPSRVLSLWDQLIVTPSKDEETKEIAQKVLANSAVESQQVGENLSGRNLQLGASSLNEYRDSDGRYHARRPPADDVLLAPTRRATMAAIDSEHDFGHQSNKI